jgi:hypothetical protein
MYVQVYIYISRVDVGHGVAYTSLMFTSITGLPELLYKSHNCFSFRCFIMFKSFLRSRNFNRPRSFINFIVLCLFYRRPLPLAFCTFSFVISPHCILSPKSYISFFFCPTEIQPSRNMSCVLLQFRISFCYRHLLARSTQPISSTVLTQDNTDT